jgi:WD40 repeat protein
VLALDFSPPVPAAAAAAAVATDGPAARMLLASASRDQLVHIFDSRTAFQLDQTTSDHSGAVTGLRFVPHPPSAAAAAAADGPHASCGRSARRGDHQSQRPQLLTCGADQKLVVRQITPARVCGAKAAAAVSDSSVRQVLRAGRSLHDLTVTHDGRFAIAAGTDHSIQVWDVASGTLARTISTEGKATPVAVVVDPSDTLMAVSGSDSGVRLYDFNTG